MTPKRKHAVDREWCAYVRVSKLNGREGESFVSVDQQTSVIESAVPGRVVKTFTELDVSGTHMNREQLNTALAWVGEDPGHRGFAVMDSSRLARNLKGAFEVIDSLTDSGAGFLSVHEQMDSTTPEGRLALQNMAAIHEFYSRNIGRRWRMVQADRIEKGLPSGGPVRFGYMVTKDEKGKVLDRLQRPHPENGQVLAQMYHDFIAGKGAMSIAKALNDAGTPSPRGGIWNIQGVLRTLDSGFGAGKIKVFEDGEVVYREGAHEAVIDEPTWEQYLRVRDVRRREAPRHKHPKWHLAKLAKCGLCGSNLLVSSYRDERTLVICGKYKSTRACSGVWMSKSKLDRAVFWWLGTRIEDIAKHAGAGKAREKAHAKASNAVDKARARLDKLSREKIGLARLNAAGDLSTAEYRAALTENEAEAAAAAEELRVAQAELDRLAPVDDVYAAIEKWGEEHDDPAEYNVLLSKVIDRIEVTKEQVVIHPVVGKSHGVPRL